MHMAVLQLQACAVQLVAPEVQAAGTKSSLKRLWLAWWHRVTLSHSALCTLYTKCRSQQSKRLNLQPLSQIVNELPLT